MYCSSTTTITTTDTTTTTKYIHILLTNVIHCDWLCFEGTLARFRMIKYFLGLAADKEFNFDPNLGDEEEDSMDEMFRYGFLNRSVCVSVCLCVCVSVYFMYACHVCISSEYFCLAVCL